MGSEPPTTPTSDTFAANNVETPFESLPDYVNIQAQPPSQFVKPRARKDSNGLESDEFLRFALEIAKGMQHLEAKGITHRDLAARNILLDANLTLKVNGNANNYRSVKHTCIFFFEAINHKYPPYVTLTVSMTHYCICV